MLAFDVFHPDAEDIAETHDRWLEREPGIWERATWDASHAPPRAGGANRTSPRRRWSSGGSIRADWRRLLGEAGFDEIHAYGWFDRSPLSPGGVDSVWIARTAG